MNHQSDTPGLGTIRGITPAVKYLIILNISVFLIEWIFNISLHKPFALEAEWFEKNAFGQVFTYMFVHADLSHLLVNMLTLFFIGPVVEKTLGSYRFFILYYLSGILGGIGWALLAPSNATCVGASGAVMGVLGAFAAFYPKSTVLLWFILPIKTWILALGLALWELYQMFDEPGVGGVANSAHLMGGIAGFLYAYTLKNPGLVRSFKNRGIHSFSKKGPMPSSSASQQDHLSKQEIDHILEKIGKKGMGALTARERELLKKATR